MNNQASFQCENCSKSFKSKAGFSNHVKTCKDKDRTNTQCIYCLNFFSKKSSLLIHYSTCKHKEIEEMKINYEKKIVSQQELLEQQHLNDIEKLKIIYEARIKDLESEVRSKNEQIVLLKEMKPSVTNNNVTNNNYQNNSSTKIGNINAINTKLRLNDDFFEKLRNNFDDKKVFLDESDVCRYTLSQGLNNYILLLDRSRKILGFEDSEGNKIRDHDGVKLARKIYKELTPCFENITEQLKTEQDDPNDYYVPTRLDRRKKLASMVAEQNKYSLESFGKSIFSEFPKYNSIENQEQKVEEIEYKDEEKVEDEKIQLSSDNNFSNLKDRIRSAYISTNFESIIAGVENQGAWLVQHQNLFHILNKKISKSEDTVYCEWFEILDDHKNVVRFTPTSFFNLIQDCFTYVDISQIISNLYPKYTEQVDRFVKIFILRQYDDKDEIEKIKQEITNWTAGVFY